MVRRLRCVMALSASLALLASCAITSGSTYGAVISAELSGSGEQSKPPDPPPSSSYRLRIITDPPGADVWLGASWLGTSPVEVAELDGGFYRLRVEKAGYYRIERWIELEPTGSLLIELPLERITGYLQVDTVPFDARITIDGQPVGTFARLPVGPYTVEITSFGYRPERRRVAIVPDGLTRLRVQLERAAFAVTAMSVSRSAFNPANPGATGSIRVDYEVSAPGSGELTVRDADGRALLRLPQGPYHTWSHSVRWDGRDQSGAMLPDGVYEVALEATGDDGLSDRRTELVSIDGSLLVRYRSVWSAAAGLLYAPTLDVLPPAQFQLTAQAAGIVTRVDDSVMARFPGRAALRAGLGAGLELLVYGGLTAHSEPVDDRWSIGGALTFRGLSLPVGPARLSAGLSAGGTYQAPSPTGLYAGPDTRASFTGLFASVPLAVSVGPVRLVATPEYRLTPAPVHYGPGDLPSNEWGAIAYLKGGLLADIGPVTLGASAALRSGRLGSPLTLELPVQLGGEIHWLLPRSSLALSAFIAGELTGPSDYYFMPGFALGFVF